ncbi:MAG: NAD(P)/FAD-dependent oxidoreductase [Dehalococcoidia bacterium]
MKKVNIIGSGIAGLSTGCYLQMNGYDTQIFEAHNHPGGVCTSWTRKGYTVDNCIHWLVGSSHSDNFYRLWNELIDMKSMKFVYSEEWMRVETPDGRSMRVFTDIDRLEQEMLEKAPADEGLVRSFTNAARRFATLQMPMRKAPETYGPVDGLKMMFGLLPFMRQLKKWSSISIQQYADRCSNPLLKRTFESMFIPETNVLFLIMTIVWMHKRSAGYPIGGSLEFARQIEKRYIELGGRINYKSRVAKISVKNDVTTGIVLDSGEEHASDIVVSAADGHSTIFDMLGGRYMDAKVKDYYDNYQTFPSYLMVSFGVARKFDDYPRTIVLFPEQPLTVDRGSKCEGIMVRIFSFDPTLAPEGKTMITTMIVTREYEYWDNLKKTAPEQYKAEKNRIAEKVLELLEKRFGDIRSKVEMIDVSTPSTVIRYTNNWKGSFEGWLSTPRVGFRGMRKTLPGLENFYMAGQWVEPGGGLPTALRSGRNVAQIICKKDKKKFTTSGF